MSDTPADKFLATIGPLLHLWQGVRASGMALNETGQWLNLGIRLQLIENPPSRAEIRSPDQRFQYYIIDYPLEFLPDAIAQLSNETFRIETAQGSGGAFADISLKPLNGQPGTHVNWYGTTKREPTADQRRAGVRRSSIALVSSGQMIHQILDQEFRLKLDSALRRADPPHDGLPGLAKLLFPGTGFENWQQTLVEVIAELPFEIESPGPGKLQIRASPRAKDGFLTTTSFYAPQVEIKPIRTVLRRDETTFSDSQVLRWDRPLDWPEGAESAKVTLFYQEEEIQSVQLSRSTVLTADAADSIQEGERTPSVHPQSRQAPIDTRRGPTASAPAKAQKAKASGSSAQAVSRAAVEVAARALSDKPSAIDLLGFGDYSQALIDLIHSPKTQTPLTIGIDGPWGSGKTTLMEMIKDKLDRQRNTPASETKSHTVWFNAWKYDREDSLWAALALEILSQVRKQISLSARCRLWIELNYKRLDKVSLLGNFLKSLVYPGFVALVAIAGIQSWHHWVDPNIDSLKLSAIALGGGLVGVVTLASKKIYDTVIKPFDLNISNYVRTPDYKQRIGFLHEFETDFKIVIDTVTHGGRSSLIVFIDDLDRCSPAKPVEVIEAINHLLDANSCVFIIGMDAQGVAASVQAKYKELHDIGEDGGESNTALGYQFLEKIIQIPFRLPKASEVLLTKLVDGNLSPGSTPDYGKREAIVMEAENLIAAAEQQGKPLQEATVSVQDSRPDIQPEAVREAARNIYAKTFEDDDEVHKAICEAVPFLLQNARKVKRFINLFRLNVLIANRRGLLERGIIRVPVLAKWLVILVRWPDFAPLATDEFFLKRYWEANSLNWRVMGASSPDEAQKGKILLAPYLEDPRIRRFVSVRQLIVILNSLHNQNSDFEEVAATLRPYVELSAVTTGLEPAMQQT